MAVKENIEEIKLLFADLFMRTYDHSNFSQAIEESKGLYDDERDGAAEESQDRILQRIINLNQYSPDEISEALSFFGHYAALRLWGLIQGHPGCRSATNFNLACLKLASPEKSGKEIQNLYDGPTLWDRSNHIRRYIISSYNIKFQTFVKSAEPNDFPHTGDIAPLATVLSEYTGKCMSYSKCLRFLESALEIWAQNKEMDYRIEEKFQMATLLCLGAYMLRNNDYDLDYNSRPDLFPDQQRSLLSLMGQSLDAPWYAGDEKESEEAAVKALKEIRETVRNLAEQTRGTEFETLFTFPQYFATELEVKIIHGKVMSVMTELDEPVLEKPQSIGQGCLPEFTQ